MKRPKTIFGFPARLVDDMPRSQILLVDPEALRPEIHQLCGGEQFLSFNLNAVAVIRNLSDLRDRTGWSARPEGSRLMPQTTTCAGGPTCMRLVAPLCNAVHVGRCRWPGAPRNFLFYQLWLWMCARVHSF